MIKANALTLIKGKPQAPDAVARGCQDIVIRCSGETDAVPGAVEELAFRMFTLDSELKEILNSLRVLYISKKEDFHISLAGKPARIQEEIVSLFRSMYGVLAEIRWCPDCEMLHGRLVFSPRAQAFITGTYLELAVCRVVRAVLEKLSQKYHTAFKLYRNVRVSTKDGRLINEFDLVIENTDDSIFYVIEVKSGKNFREFDRLSAIGKEYGIVPQRLLLVDSYLSEPQSEIVEYFCGYYASGLVQDTLEAKIAGMLENDLPQERRD